MTTTEQPSTQVHHRSWFRQHRSVVTLLAFALLSTVGVSIGLSTLGHHSDPAIPPNRIAVISSNLSLDVGPWCGYSTNLNDVSYQGYLNQGTWEVWTYEVKDGTGNYQQVQVSTPSGSSWAQVASWEDGSGNLTPPTNHNLQVSCSG